MSPMTTIDCERNTECEQAV